MKIEEMSAGRELDALVADKVMGLKEVHVGSMTAWNNPAQSGQYPSPGKCNKDSPRGSYNEYVYLARPNGEQHSIYRGDTRWDRVLEYSLDMNAAMNVLEIARKIGSNAKLIHFGRWRDVPKPLPENHNWPPPGREFGCQLVEGEYVTWASGFCEAICLAALAAVGHKEKEHGD